MEQTKYDVFISYRRVGGKEYARTLKPELEKRGYKVFLDFDELDDGVFDQRIKDAISASSVFLLILSKGALDRCINESDWVREEILHAQKCHCHILPVEFDKSFRDLPENTPDELSAIIGAHSWAQIDTEALLRESVDKMVKKNIAPYIKHEEVKTGVEIHIDVDADCDLFRFKTFIKHLKAGEDNVVYFKPGKYKLEFVSLEFPEVKESRVHEIAIGIECDFMQIPLKDKVEGKRRATEEEAKRKAEEEAKRKAEEEARRKAEEAKRKAEEEHQRKLKVLENTKLKPFSKDGKGGYVDELGKVVIPCQWKDARSFSEGLAGVRDDTKRWGYIDKLGMVVIPCKWKDAWGFSEGYARVMDNNSRCGFIDKTGKVVIPCLWKLAGSFSEGWASVEDDNGKWWKIDKRGEIMEDREKTEEEARRKAEEEVKQKTTGKGKKEEGQSCTTCYDKKQTCPVCGYIRVNNNKNCYHCGYSFVQAIPPPKVDLKSRSKTAITSAKDSNDFQPNRQQSLNIDTKENSQENSQSFSGKYFIRAMRVILTIIYILVIIIGICDDGLMWISSHKSIIIGGGTALSALYKYGN